MATPANRVPVRIARGTKANLDTAMTAGDLKEGEVCYATNENTLYVVESSTLTQAGANLSLSSIDELSDVDTTTVTPTDGQALLWDNANSYWEPGDVYADPLTTDGDILYRASGVTTRLAVGSDGQVLKVSSGLPVWSADAGATSRTSVNNTTASIADAASANMTITGTGKTGQLLSIETSHAAWVTVYVSQATRTADSGRAETTDPDPGSGVLAEVITAGAETVLITPCVNHFNNETVVADELYLKVVNKSGSAATITVTLKVMPTES